MNISKIALALGLTLGATACSSGPSKDEARAGYLLASGLATSFAGTARTNAGQSLRSTETLPGVCPAGGSVEWSGSGTATSLNFTFAFNACNLGAAVMDGSWAITGTVDSTKVVGDLSLEGEGFGFSCAFDLTVTPAGAVSGSACGYDVADLSTTGA